MLRTSALTIAVVLAVAGCVPTHTTMEFPTWTPSPVAIALPPSGGIDYQLGGAYDPPKGTAIVARDSREASAPGLYNICYLNGFQTQPGEAAYWQSLLLEDATGQPIADPDWPDEYLLDTSTTENRDTIAAAMEPRIARCADAGFDAVEFDNLDSYPRSDGALTKEDNLALASAYVAYAHGLGLAVAQKNAVEIAHEGRAAGFDFAVTEECGLYQECAGYQAVYDIVLDIEYGDSADYQALCEAGALPSQSVRRDRDLVTPASGGYVFERCG